MGRWIHVGIAKRLGRVSEAGQAGSAIHACPSALLMLHSRDGMVGIIHYRPLSINIFSMF